MKKFILATAVMLGVWSLANAGDGPLVGTPRGGPQALATADYGGVSYAVSSFPVSGTGVNFSTVVIPLSTDRKNSVTGVFYGVMFSSGNAAAYDFVDVFDSTSSDLATKQGAIMRLYNVNGSTGNAGTSFALSGFSGPPKPVRFNRGLIIRAGVATYNHITTLFYREP